MNKSLTPTPLQRRGTIIIFVIFLCNTLFAQQKRPNIVFIFSDDHDQTTISAYGNALNKTPNIDRIAANGMVFKNSFCTNSICAPSRAVILTGKHSHINGLRDNAPATRFDSSQVTFPKILQQNGYQTALVGKWHLKSNPTGFDYWDIHDDQGQYYNPDFISANGRRRVSGYSTDITADLSLDWLEKNKNSQKPFLLMVQNKSPHSPFYPNLKHLNLYDSVTFPAPATLHEDYKTLGTAAKDQEMSILNILSPVGELKVNRAVATYLSVPGIGSRRDMNYEFLELSRMNPEQRKAYDQFINKRSLQLLRQSPKGDKEMLDWKYQQYIKDYLRCIASVDENVGKILDYLEKNGLAENTIVVYSSDQGFWMGQNGWFDKRFMYEQSMRMPLIIRYPGVTEGASCDKMVQNLDYAETFLDIAGIQPPKEMQGISLLPLLKGENPKNFRDVLYYEYFEFPQPHHVHPHYGVRTDRYKLIYFHTLKEWELFDLKTDPHEKINLVSNKQYASLLTDMKKKLTEARTKYKVPVL